MAAIYIDNAFDMTFIPREAVDTEFGDGMTTEHAQETINATSILECVHSTPDASYSIVLKLEAISYQRNTDTRITRKKYLIRKFLLKS